MLEFLKTSEGLMKSKLNMESLTKPELLMLFSILEGELEARDLVIDALKIVVFSLSAEERYGKYNLSDPFQALQRDSEAVGDQLKEPGCPSTTSNPLVVLKLVVGHCRRMQEKMLAQLAAAEQLEFERSQVRRLEKEQRRMTVSRSKRTAQHNSSPALWPKSASGQVPGLWRRDNRLSEVEPQARQGEGVLSGPEKRAGG
ncbi:hypothetical protein KUCAC02_030357 [Chaenocephalus aceratus]|uniref:Uncharacterized protein n=1 Tax=Chaenocephalus aceratus TaxID=36190 RepID=A0ACB9XIL7_CHAAC|nr:hypothetical protein KUCAC02_030357 [Chaenocephalus aceratus]